MFLLPPQPSGVILLWLQSLLVGLWGDVLKDDKLVFEKATPIYWSDQCVNIEIPTMTMVPLLTPGLGQTD